MLTTLIFDLDDTLYPEYQFVFSGYQHINEYYMNKYHVDLLNHLIHNFKDGRHHNTFIDTPKEVGIEITKKEFLSEILPRYREHMPTISLYNGFSENLDFFKTYQLAIITDGLSITQRNKIKALNLESIFDYIIVTSELGENKSKPHGEAYENVLEHFRIKPQESVYIGDNAYKDFVYPNTINMHSIQLLNTQENTHLIHQHNEVMQSADFSVYSYNELINTIKGYK